MMLYMLCCMSSALPFHCTLYETLLLRLAIIHLELKMKQITLDLIYVGSWELYWVKKQLLVY